MSEEIAKRLATYTGAAFIAGVTAYSLVTGCARPAQRPLSGDDQPPIIVTDGSIIFDGGDKYNPSKGTDTWNYVDQQHWKALKTTGQGFHVQSFTAYIDGVSDATNCPQTTIVGDSIDIDYSVKGNTYTFHLVHAPDGAPSPHDSPEVTSDQLPITSVTGSSPPQVTAGNPREGGVSRVAGMDKTSTTRKPVECKIVENSKNVRVTIVPERNPSK